MKIHMIAGTGRSGTTWLANIINFANDYRLIFEPFNPRKVKEVKSYGYRQYLRPENIDKAFLLPASDILLGHVNNSWVNRFTVVPSMKTCSTKACFTSSPMKVCSTKYCPLGFSTPGFRKNLIKDIRANHLLKWLDTHFEMKIVLLLRHPCAVAYSKMKLNWETHLDVFLNQQDLVEDFLSPFVSEIRGAKTDFEKHIFLWAIENYVPLQQFDVQKGEIHLVFYENLCTQPKLELEDLFSYLDRAYSPRALEIAKKPSSTCRPGSSILHGKNLVGEYRKHLSTEQIKRAVEILEIFDLDYMYNDHLFPFGKEIGNG